MPVQVTELKYRSEVDTLEHNAAKVLEHVGGGSQRKDLGQRAPTGENPNEGMYEMHRSTHKHSH